MDMKFTEHREDDAEGKKIIKEGEKSYTEEGGEDNEKTLPKKSNSCNE